MSKCPAESGFSCGRRLVKSRFYVRAKSMSIMIFGARVNLVIVRLSGVNFMVGINLVFIIKK